MKNINNKSYFSAKAGVQIKVKEVVLTIETAIALVFKILKITHPSKEQLAFAKTEVMSAKASRTFKNMILTFAGWCGTQESYYDIRYRFVD